VATRLLARPEARVLTCFGAGAQAVRQIEAVCIVRPIERVMICSRTPERAEALAARVLAAGWSQEATVEPDPTAAAHAADVICTATTASTPVMPAEAVRPGCHLNGIGSYRPDLAELPAALVARARVVVDHGAAARQEAGDLIQAVAAGLATEEVFATELGAVAADRRLGRRAADEITLFKSVGNAVQDVAVARLVIDEARRRGLGRDIDL
jgi:ornithine cyclodeaminase